MIKRLGLLAAGVLANYSVAATAVVFTDEDGVKVDKPIAQTYSYDYGSGASVDSTDVNGAKVLDFTAPTTTDGKSGAGYGFAWAIDASYKPKVTSLSGYKGVCLAYEATAPFRVDFKQSTITDDNFYGMEMAATKGVVKKSYISFSEITQGWKSKTTVAWSIASQLGVQFSYKDSHAKSSKSGSNEVILHSFTLADECVTAAPNVTEGFAGYNNGSIELAEGAVHTMNMAEVFEDADGDDLVITVKIVSENKSVVLVDSTKYDQNSIIKFTTAPNPDGPAEITLTATDPTKKTATFKFTINTEDTDNLPVAKKLTFEVLEDSSYKGSNLPKLCSDADGDITQWVQISDPEHGTLEIKPLTGAFTYTPEANFFGSDSFTYKCVEKDNPERESDTVAAVITVKNVNDRPLVKVVTKTFLDTNEDERALGDTLTVDEDFDDFVVAFPKANISITDADGDSDYKVTGKANAVVTATVSQSTDAYLITVSAKKDSNGLAKVNLVVSDPEVSLSTLLFYVKVNPVADAPIAKEDTYDVLQGKSEISAKKGVLANDIDPDGDTTLIAVLDEEPSQGKVVLNKDGSFVYTTDDLDYEGDDMFAYHVENGAGMKSEPTTVLLNVKYRNKSPILVVEESSLDTTMVEDTGVLSYSNTVIEKWFSDPEKDPLTYTLKSADGKTAIQATKTAYVISAERNAYGDAYVDVIVKDGKSDSLKFQIHINITPTQDPPEWVRRDTLVVEKSSKWKKVVDLTELINDPDGDSLTYRMVTIPNGFKAEIKGDSMVVTLESDTVEIKDGFYKLKVRAYDATDSANAIVVLAVGAATDAIAPQMASAKLNWQGAIQADRGTVSMMDMQGRVMWTRRLPVSEAEVRAAAASVQGRKVLRVNSQVYTIK